MDGYNPTEFSLRQLRDDMKWARQHRDNMMEHCEGHKAMNRIVAYMDHVLQQQERVQLFCDSIKNKE